VADESKPEPDPHGEEELTEREKEIYQKMEALLNGSDEHLKLPDSPEIDAIEAKRAALEEKVEKAAGAPLPEVPDWDYKRPHVAALKKPEENGGNNGLAQGFAIGYSVIGGAIAGLLLGLGLQKWLGFVAGPGIGATVGLGVGVFLAIRMTNEKG
jgi:hypothetical protein